VATPQVGAGRYASTTQTARELVRLAGGTGGGFLVEAHDHYSGSAQRQEHVAALHQWGPDLVRRAVVAILGQRGPEGVSPAAAEPPPAVEAHPTLWPTLRRGDRGEAVAELQRRLLVTADGIFGPGTEAAAKAAQARLGLVVDGIVGARTWAALSASPAGPPPKPAPVAPSTPSTPLRPLSEAERVALFGRLEFVAAPVAGNPEAIRITNDYAVNIVAVTVPQLVGVDGSPGGFAQFHRIVAPQVLALFAAWEAAGLLPLVLSWAGSWAPRFVRGSKTTLSNHAFGTAFDINAAWNGLGVKPAPSGARGSVVDLVPLARAHGLFWGGDFSRPDGMHFEAARDVGASGQHGPPRKGGEAGERGALDA
jgi:peptidoglycan hydrolase-like protein with peptidoglycan-binding domain